MHIDFFANTLIDWYWSNYRDLPWRNTRDPYKIWLSEIILQQTRVSQGLPYYLRFVNAYPDIYSLAAATEDQVLKYWQGLGYYSRARNMHTTARYIVKEHGGVFPNKYSEIIALKGIGQYTAAAISSFAFKLPYPVIDGNVERVLSRYFAIEEDPASGPGRKILTAFLKTIFDEERPDLFNQAIMELGALVCLPKVPACNKCPLNNHCAVLATGQQERYPVKDRKTTVKKVYFTYFVIRYGKKTYIEQRQSGIWKQLYQFPMTEQKILRRNLPAFLASTYDIETDAEIELSYECTHQLTHRKISAYFYTIKTRIKPVFSKSTIFETDYEELSDQYPIPVLIEKFLKHK